MSPHAMYFLPKNDQNKNFPDTTLLINDSKQLFPYSDQVLNKSDVQFRRKLAIFGQNLENDHFFQNPLATFFSFINLKLCEKKS